MALNKLVGTERKKKTELGTGQDPESREEERVPALPGLEESLGGWSWASAPGTVFASSCWRQKVPEARAAGFSLLPRCQNAGSLQGAFVLCSYFR